ncbi:amino acid permease [Enemella evansiae]|uniref:APC family permease n=1 Tax=Enemella evansiae TaxID=2016499 RepID=UPI000B976A31|nr:APC family permease [Enemella evansiae]OYN95843.1 amino acid permease [Enemella evansiae]
MVDPADTQPRFKKALGTVDSYALGFGAMIGFGWVVLTGGWISDAGTFGAVVAMVIGGLIMAVVGLVYAELTAAIPKAGGEHNFLMRGLGPRWAFLGSWGITGGYITIVAFEAVALPRTIAYILPQVNSGPSWTMFGSPVFLVWALIGSLAAVVITAINIVGIKAAGVTQTFVVLFLLIVGVLLAVGAGTGGSGANMAPFFTGAGGLFTVLIVVPFLYVGFDVIPQASEELNLAPNRIGRLIVISVLIATGWYVLTIVTTSSSMPADRLAASDLATADAMAALFGNPVMAKVLLAGGIAGILTSWIALLIGASRLLYALGESGMLPRWFGRLHPRLQTPVNALLFVGALSAIAPFFGPDMLGWLVDSGSPSIVIAYLLVCLVFVMLRRREPRMGRPFVAGGPGRGGIVLGIAGVVLCAGLLSLYIPGMPASIAPASYALFVAWWVLGLVFLLRVPTGIQPGPDAEPALHRALAERRAGRGGG